MAKYCLLALRRSESEAEPVTEVNIIPVIDISLVLLVILFVTAPLLSYPNLPVDLPKAGAPESQEPALTLTCTKEGRLSIRSTDTDWVGLEAALRRELGRAPGSSVVLRADRAVPYRLVERLLAAAKAAGAGQISLATQPYSR